MKKPKWKDTTSRRFNEPTKEADSWELTGRHLRIHVHAYLNYAGWYLTCYDLRIERYELKSKLPEEARAEALLYIDARLEVLRRDFDKLAAKKTSR